MIAALYVEQNGPYSELSEVEIWDVTRDARNYRGPYPVVAHPPCERWGRYWGGGPSVKDPRLLGDDHGCFAHALWAVRTFGGVLEHPEASHAWDWFGLRNPPKDGGWVRADTFGGVTCCVEQGHYGHPARKATWLYMVGGRFVEMKWGKAHGKRRLDEGFHSTAARREARARGVKAAERLTRDERIHTPREFRDLLVSMVTRQEVKAA